THQQAVLDGPDRFRLVAVLVVLGALDHPAVEVLAVEQVAVVVGGRPRAGGKEQQDGRSPASALHWIFSLTGTQKMRYGPCAEGLVLLPGSQSTPRCATSAARFSPRRVPPGSAL